MVTNEDRRRVAAKLREYASWDSEGTLVEYLDWGESVLNLLDCGDTEGECYAALAELIEPGDLGDPIEDIKKWCLSAMEGADGALDTMLCEIVGAIEEYQHPELVRAETKRAVDRDVLLALADAMERKADDFDATVGDVPMVHAGYLTAYAARIREACGKVVDHGDE